MTDTDWYQVMANEHGLTRARAKEIFLSQVYNRRLEGDVPDLLNSASGQKMMARLMERES